MAKQVITVSEGGAVSGLQRKPGQGLDLRTLGPARIERASEIVFDEHHQQWKVQILKGRFAGRVLSHDLITDACVLGILPDMDYDRVAQPESQFLYDEYDVAVADEIRFLDAVRLHKAAWLE